MNWLDTVVIDFHQLFDPMNSWFFSVSMLYIIVYVLIGIYITEKSDKFFLGFNFFLCGFFVWLLWLFNGTIYTISSAVVMIVLGNLIMKEFTKLVVK